MHCVYVQSIESLYIFYTVYRHTLVLGYGIHLAEKRNEIHGNNFHQILSTHHIWPQLNRNE